MVFKTEAQKKVYEKMREYLFTLFGEVNVTTMAEALVLQEGSTFVYVRAAAIGERQTSVEIFSYVIVEVEITDALMRYLLTYNLKLVLGGFGLSIDDNGKGTVVLTHTILGDALDKEQLYTCVTAIARVADDLDDKIVQMFGGKTALGKLSAPPLVEVWE
ncbi:MAG: hypothetical protein HY231_03595 [Acidobacteria bacterium]|nr:hypothetical protein [Acidobacteriota bacterium]